MAIEQIRKQFPVLRQNIYVNTPVLGPFYDDLLDWRQERDLDFLLKASDMRGQTLATISETRTAVSEYFDCKRENVALVNNFSTGLNMLLEGVAKNRKVLLLANDYPSVDWPFMSRGFEILYAQIDENLEATIAHIIATEEVSILALSLVQWQTGLKIDLDFLVALKSRHPNLLIIADGTQFLGTTNFSFANSGIDVLGASAYKWLLAGYGSGFMMFKDGVQEQCDLKTIGFNAANAVPEKKNDIRFARRFEPGHLACINFGSLKFSLDFMSKIGKDTIEAQNQKLARKAKAAFTELGLLHAVAITRRPQSTIFNIKGDTALFETLTNNDVVCAQRGEGIRMGFHFYNSENDIDFICDLLKKHT